MSFDVTNFEEDVLEASREKPVVVDFWAPWCGPCRVLGPILEKLAGEQTNQWKLAKVNTEDFQRIAQQYDIKGIPAVKLFVDGNVTDEFTGALPEQSVRQWLDKAIPTPARTSISSAEKLFSEGDLPGAAEILEQVVTAEPTNVAAAGLLARCLAFKDSDRAQKLAIIASAGDPRFLPVAEALRSLASYRTRIRSNTPFPDEPGRDDFIRGLTALADDRLEEVVMALLEVIKVNRNYENDAPRKMGVAIFTLLGETHPLTRSYRRTFNMWLT